MSFHEFRGQRSGKPAEATRGFSQATNRNKLTTFDQFGRQYTVPVEKSTGMPCGIIMPDFQAPWIPDYHPDYWIINPENPSQLYLNLDALIKDRIRAMREYHEGAVFIAEKKGWEIPKLGEYSDDIISICRKPPRAYQLAVALLQGNPWILGETDVPDPRLVMYLETPTREIDETLESHNFGPESYNEQVRGRGPVRRRAAASSEVPPPSPNRFRDLKDLARIDPRHLRNIDANDAEAVARAVGADATETDQFAEERKAELRFLAENEDAMSDLTQLGTGEGDETDTVIDGIDDLETEPDEDEAADADLLARLAIEEAADPEALGGRRVPPKQAERVNRQSARPKGQAPKAQHERSGKAWTAGRRSLADGATPVVGS